MELLMYIENDLIDSVLIQADKVTYPGYLGAFIKMLRQKHADVIQQSYSEAEFLVRKVVYEVPRK